MCVFQSDEFLIQSGRTTVTHCCTGHFPQPFQPKMVGMGESWEMVLLRVKRNKLRFKCKYINRNGVTQQWNWAKLVHKTNKQRHRALKN